jgi:soluble epoxide hydrolase/lipid-phosphate phosphatase
MASSNKLVPNDPRVRYESADVRGNKYTYILAEPKGEVVDTIFLCHGWPDMAFGWRYQIPFLVDQGYRVVAPNMLGYAGTARPEAIEAYTFKSVAEDIRELARQLLGPDPNIILGGHDWGGAVVWRVAMWFPELIKAVFSVCTPFFPVQTQYFALEDIIAGGRLHNFKYQLKLGGPEVEARLQGPEGCRQLLTALYGGTTPEGGAGFSVSDGPIYENLPKLGPSPLVSAAEMDHYVEQYTLQDAPELRGPLNWYRTRKANFDADLPLAKTFTQIEMPALFICATRDTALPPEMSAGMEKAFKQLTRGEVNASHWALWQAADQVNEQILSWLKNVHAGSKL